jgi:hypothetical protein
VCLHTHSSALGNRGLKNGNLSLLQVR